jgi:microcystin-dependent protein
MTTGYVGEIRLFAGNYAPQSWLFCFGQILPISQYEVLFNLIGTTFGGDGQTNFGLPDLRGRVPIHQGTGVGLTPRTLGTSGGEETVTLTSNQLPSHTHMVLAGTSAANSISPADSVPATPSSGALYLPPGSGQNPVSPVMAAISQAGGSQPHENMMPSLALAPIICVLGIYPQPN